MRNFCSNPKSGFEDFTRARKSPRTFAQGCTSVRTRGGRYLLVICFHVLVGKGVGGALMYKN